MEDGYDVLIVGTGHAGAQAAVALNREKFTGTVGLVGEEPDLPYERPPLSKDYFAGDQEFKRMLLAPPVFWETGRRTLLPGRRVVSVDPAAHTVKCLDGSTIGYGKLIWAAGGTPRRLTCPGHDFVGVHSVRTRADVDQMVAELPGTEAVTVVGGGYIGMEAAAVLTKLGRRVTLVEEAARVLSRNAGEPISRFYEAEHRAHGVDVRLNTGVASIEGPDAKVSAVRLSNGDLVQCQMVIVGIGITPSVDPLLAAGAVGDNGVLIDGHCRTSLKDVFAIGDCALHRNRYACDVPVRLESVQNANDQAGVAAKVICGQPAVYDAVPWFWSNQYDLKLQTVGLSSGHDEVITRGNPSDRSFSLIYRRAGAVIAIDSVNMMRDYVQGRALVIEGASVPREWLADPTISLKEIAQSLARGSQLAVAGV